MIWIGDTAVLVLSVVALIYGIRKLLRRNIALYFQLIIGAVGCSILAYVFDLCELLTAGDVSEGFNIGYFGNIGSFLFLLTANFGCMDGILDDGTASVRRSRVIALAAPLVTALMFIPNLFAGIRTGTMVMYILVWVCAAFTSYLSLKHAVIPDMGFGFVRAIRPFNISTLVFTALELTHLTLWNTRSWLPLIFSGVLLGVATLAMVITAERGVRRWTL